LVVRFTHAREAIVTRRTPPRWLVKILALCAFFLLVGEVRADTVEEQLAAAVRNLLAEGSALKAQRAHLEQGQKALGALVGALGGSLQSSWSNFTFHFSDSQVKAFRKWQDLQNQESLAAFSRMLTAKQRDDFSALSEKVDRYENARNTLADEIAEFNERIDRYDQTKETLTTAVEIAAAQSRAEDVQQAQRLQATLGVMGITQELSQPPSSNAVTCLPFGMGGVRCTGN
jgi:hypothetical protein